MHDVALTIIFLQNVREFLL